MKGFAVIFIMLCCLLNVSAQSQRLNCASDQVVDELMDKDPRFAKDHREYLKSIPDRINFDSRSVLAPIIRIPVVVHIIHSGEPIGTGQNLPVGQIEAQIDVLNEDFNAENPTYASAPARWTDVIGNAEIQFCLASIDPDGNPTNGITRDQIEVTGTNLDNDNIETDIKPAVYWPSNFYYNVYVLPIPGTDASGGTTGYAYFPSSAGQINDGAVVDYRWFGGPGYPQSGSGTLTHETGHYMGLPHPFSGNSCSADDGIADTPNIDHSSGWMGNCSNGWPTGDISCGNEAMYINFMDYTSPDQCVNSFSLDQISIMRATMANERLSLANNATAVCAFNDYDIALVSIFSPGTRACSQSDVTPSISITNFGLETVTNLTITYQVDLQIPVVLNWVDNIISGETQTVSLAPFTPPIPTYNFSVWIDSPNGMVDENPDNDSLSISSNIVTPSSLPLFEGFEDVNFNPTINGILVSNPDADGNVWQRTANYSGYGNSQACTWFDNFNASDGIGKLDALITPVYEFTSPTQTTLTFDYAYAYYQITGQINYDSLIVAVSIDCGNTFNQILLREGGQDLATTQPYATPFQPFPNEWQSKSIDLSILGNPDNISIAFINKSGYGNNLYLDNINISGPCALAVNLDIQNVSCNNLCDGTVLALASGATGILDYEWSDGLGSLTDDFVSGVCPGDYDVTITDETGCEVIETFSITEPDLLTVGSTVDHEMSNGGNDGQIVLNPLGGTGTYSYNWLPNVSTTETATNLSPGFYDVTVTDENGCPATINFEILAYDCSGFLLDFSQSNVDCNGNDTGSITLNPSGGEGPYTFLWDVSGVVGNNPTGLVAGDYNVTVTDIRNCEQLLTVTISEPDVLEINLSSTDETGSGANNGTATAMAAAGTPPFSYDWGPQGTGPTISGLEPGTYSVTAFDSQDCEIIGSVTINSFDCGLFSAVLTSTDISCFGENDGAASVDVSGTEPFVYNWSVAGGVGNSHSSLPPGVFSVSVSDANNCSTILSDEIISPDELTVSLNIDAEVLCFGASTAALSSNMSGGTQPFSYLWNFNASTTSSISNLPAGYYSLTISDSNDCTTADEYTFTDPEEISIEYILSEPSCFGIADGSIAVTTFGGTGILDPSWNIPQTGLTISDLDAGFYTLTLIDENGCEFSETIELNGPTEIVPSFIVMPESTSGANDGSIMASGTGGVGSLSFNWGPPLGISNDLSSLSPGIYPVTVSDETGCQIIDQVEILAGGIDCSTLEILVEMVPVTCNGFNDGMVNAVGIGGLEDYQFDWSNNASGPSVIGLPPGPITVTLTDANNCQVQQTVIVTEPDELSVGISITDETLEGANDGIINAMGSGGVPDYIYDWGPDGIGANLTDLSPGTYTLTLSDVNNCSIIETVVINAGPVDCSGLGVEIVVDPIDCNNANNGSAQAIGFGGDGQYSFIWSNMQTGPIATGLSPGTVMVTISDGNDCETFQSVVIDNPDPIEAITSSVPASQPGMADGSATALGSGGTGTLTYSWSNMQMGSTITGLLEGTYTVTISDELDCFIIETIEVGSGAIDCSSLGVEIIIDPIDCNNANNGTAQAIGFGGDGQYIFNWSNTQTGPIATGLSPGMLFVTVTDGNDCESIQSIELVNPEPIIATTSSIPASEPGMANGSATAIGSGGTGSLNYSWSNMQNGSTITGLLEGIYSVTISDENGCFIIESVEVNSGPVDCSGFNGELTIVSPPCGSFENGSASVLLSGLVSPVSFNWSQSGAPNLPEVTLPVGPFSVLIINGNGCELELNGNIDFISPITVSNSVVNETSGPGLSDGSITLTGIQGGIGTLSIDWSNSMSGESISGLAPGFYIVTITDEGDCQLTETFEVLEGAGCLLDFTSSTTPVSCNGLSDGTAEVFPSGGFGPYSYLWSNSSILANITGPAGLYSVTISDSQGCGNVVQIEITEPNPIAVQVFGFDGACGNLGSASAQGSGGTPSYSFNWSTGSMQPSINNLAAGIYAVTITDQNGCEDIGDTEVVNTGNLFEINSFIQPVSCEGLSDGAIELAIVQGTPPYEVLWSNGSTAMSISNLPAGNYSVQIMDAAGCDFISQFEVQSPGQIVIDFDIDYPDGTDSNGSIQASVFGGQPPYTYQWSNGQNGPFLIDVDFGTYSLEVTDANGCTYSESVTISTTPTHNIEGLTEWNIFPNPTNQDVSIEIKLLEKKPLDISLFDMHGRKVKQLFRQGSQIVEKISISDLAAGTYLMVIMDENKNVERDKLVVLKK